jgi:hypothetical protein
MDLKFRAEVAAKFSLADRVEVFLLDFAMGEDIAYRPKDHEETFSIRPYDRETKILERREVPAEEIRHWCAAMAKTVTSEKPRKGAWCHYPIHGIRIYARGELLFETSLCWVCHNYYCERDWQSLTEDASDLEKLLDDLMPIPEQEKIRFKQGGYA